MKQGTERKDGKAMLTCTHCGKRQKIRPNRMVLLPDGKTVAVECIECLRAFDVQVDEPGSSR